MVFQQFYLCLLYTSDGKPQFQDNFVTLANRAGFQTWWFYNPVSYTHLDVYKRQSSTLAVACVPLSLTSACATTRE